METLEQHNREAFAASRACGKPRPNGIECPKCNGELWDSNPMMVLTSNPPQYNVHCPKCGYAGYRFC